MHWHTKDIETVIRSLKSGPEGLDTRTAAERLVVYGSNEIEEEKKKPAWLLFLGQFKDFMILALIAAAIIAGFLADITDTIIILTIVIINAVVGFIQEYKAGKAIEALKKYRHCRRRWSGMEMFYWCGRRNWFPGILSCWSRVM